MSRRQVVTCDRCGAGDDGLDNEARSKWGQVYAATLGQDARVGTATAAADLCAGCLDELMLFMTGPVTEPAPPREGKP